MTWREDMAHGLALEAAGAYEAALDIYFMGMASTGPGEGRTEIELRLIAMLVQLDRADEALAMATSQANTLRASDRATALRYAQLVVTAAPQSPEAWFDLATDLEVLGRLPEALAAIARCVALEPSQGDGWYNLACYRALSGDVAGACEALGFAVRLAPENARLAVEDADFAEIRSDPRFLAVTA
jgi:Flp pilus assembly protein TadD